MRGEPIHAFIDGLTRGEAYLDLSPETISFAQRDHYCSLGFIDARHRWTEHLHQANFYLGWRTVWERKYQQWSDLDTQKHAQNASSLVELALYDLVHVYKDLLNTPDIVRAQEALHHLWDALGKIHTVITSVPTEE